MTSLAILVACLALSAISCTGNAPTNSSGNPGPRQSANPPGREPADHLGEDNDLAGGAPAIGERPLNLTASLGGSNFEPAWSPRRQKTSLYSAAPSIAVNPTPGIRDLGYERRWL